MEIVLRDSSLYKNLFQKLAFPILLIEVVDEELEQYRLIETNEAACSLLEFEKSDFINKDIMFLFKNVSTKVRAVIKDLLFTRGEFSTILDLSNGRNHTITVEMNASVYTEGEKKLIYCMLKKYEEPCCFHERLIEENYYLQTVINTVQSIVLILDKEGRIFQWNQYAEDLTGYRLQDVQCQKFWDLFIDQDEKNRIVDNYISGRIPSEYENFWILNNGQKHYFKWKSVIVTDGEGETSYIISTGVDITHQVESLNELERSKEKYRTLVSSMDDLVFTVDQNLTITTAYGRWMETKGFSKDFFEGKSVAEIFPETILQQEQCIKSLNGDSREFEWDLILEGKTHYFHSVLSPIILKNNTVKEIVSVTRDITEKKMQEENNKRIYEAVTSGIVVHDSTGKIILANKNASRILGYSEDQLTRMSSMNEEWEAVSKSGEELPGEEHPVMKTMITGEPISNIEMAIYNPEKDEKRWILVDSRPIFEAGSTEKIEYVLATFHDITEKKETDLLLQQTEKLAVIGQLASGIAHEIRNPLTGIMGFLKLLDESPEKEKLFDYLPVIKQELNQIHQITEEFIELSLPKNPIWAHVDVVKSMYSALSFLKTELDSNEIQVNILPTYEDTIIWGVESQLKQLFVHLIKNSIEAMTFGGRLTLKVESFEDRLEISVQDDGKGISPERLKHLGEPYYSIKEKGTGLGLMRCLKITHDHKGKISFSSEAGEGTVVKLEFERIK